MGIWLLSVWIAASIDGRLWNPVTGAPVRKADVVVGTTGGVAVKRAITDSNGHYAVEGLPAGRYRVAAGRAGYLPALSNTVVSLKVDEVRHDVNIAMDRPATISGHVVDAEGDPVERIKVVALRSADGKVARVGQSETSDRGEYRISGLIAGSYVLRTLQLDTFAPVFYPAATEFESAAPVNVARGSEARDIDLRVSLAPLGSITGVVNGPVRQLASVRAARKSTDAMMWAMPEAEAGVVTEGGFAFPKLAPGIYFVTASLEQPGNRLFWVSKEVVINGGAAEVELTLAPARELLGGVNEPAAVTLTRVNSFRSEARSDDTGKLVFRNITPGTWDLDVIPIAPDSFVDSVRWGEKEMLGKPLEIGGGAFPKLQIHVSTNGGTLEGEGGSVTLTPENGGRALEAIAGDDGRYRIRGIRPGKYRLACTDELIEVTAGAVVKRDCKS